MTAHVWNWSDIVDPQMVERAMADEKRRAERRALLVKPDPATTRRDDRRSVDA